MKTKLFKRLFVLVLLAGIAFSCKGPEGPAGKDGEDGKDGNANVQTYVFNNPSWESGGPYMQIDMPGILTQDVLDNDVILVYIKNDDGSNFNYVWQLPGQVWCGTTYRYRYYALVFDVDYFWIISRELDGSFTQVSDLYPVDWVKVIIIESTNTSTTSGNGSRPAKYEILDKMEKDGVDLNDYYQVCDYLNIEP